MAEQLVLDQIRWNGPAIHGNERFAGAGAEVVEGHGRDLLDLCNPSRAFADQLLQAKFFLELQDDWINPVAQSPKTGKEVKSSERRR